MMKRGAETLRDLSKGLEKRGDWTIRAFCPEDARYLSRIYRAAVQTLAARFYTTEQITAWLSIAPKPEDIAAIYGDGRTALVSEADGRPIAFSDHDAAGHIRFLYCDPRHAGRGAADQLVSAIEASAWRQGIGLLSSEASEAAIGFFHRHGFRVITRRELEIVGVVIHNYAVEKCLVTASPLPRPKDPLP